MVQILGLQQRRLGGEDGDSFRQGFLPRLRREDGDLLGVRTKTSFQGRWSRKQQNKNVASLFFREKNLFGTSYRFGTEACAALLILSAFHFLA